MIKRIALLVGSIAAAGVLAIGLAAAGFGPVATTGDSGDSGDSGVARDQALLDVAGAVLADAAVQVQTETVYVKPAPEPRIIHVTRKVPAKKASAAITSSRASRPGGDDDDDDDHEERDHEEREHEEREHEGEDD